MQSRIYVVMNGEQRRLVDATSAAQAVRYCVANVYKAKPATPKEIAALMSGGLLVERATSQTESTGTNASEKQGE